LRQDYRQISGVVSPCTDHRVKIIIPTGYDQTRKSRGTAANLLLWL
jgi:hypothetical protein